MRLSQIRCRIPIVRTTAVLLLAAALAACSANGKLATPGTSSDTGGSGTNTGGGTTTSGTTTPTPTVTVSVNPQVVTPGGTSTITWTTTNATACDSQRLLVRHGAGKQCDWCNDRRSDHGWHLHLRAHLYGARWLWQRIAAGLRRCGECAGHESDDHARGYSAR